MFLTATFDWATTHTGKLFSSHVFTAAVIVDVFPVPGGPENMTTFSCNSDLDVQHCHHERSPAEPNRQA